MTLVRVVSISLTTVQRFLSISKSDRRVSGTFFHHQSEKDFDLDQLCFILANPSLFLTVYIPNSQHYPTALTHFSFSWMTRFLQRFVLEASWVNSQTQPALLTCPMMNWSNHSEVRKETSPGIHLVIFPFSFSLEHLEGDTCQETFHVMISAENRGQLLTFLFLFLKKHVGSKMTIVSIDVLLPCTILSTMAL